MYWANVKLEVVFHIGVEGQEFKKEIKSDLENLSVE
jgi:hypothetical protein